MTKLVINWESPPAQSTRFAEALAALPECSIVAYHVEENLLYVRDDYAVAAISYLKAIGIRAEVLERVEQ